MKSKSAWIIFLLLLFVTSYYREVLFRSINALINGENFFYAKTTELPFLKSWTSQNLLKLKYVLTVVLSLFFMVLTSVGLKNSFKERAPFYISILIYGLLILTAIVISIIGIFFFGFSETYPTLRALVGWIHNPVLYLLISVGMIGFLATKPSKKS